MLFPERQINKDEFQKTIVSAEHSKKHIAHNVHQCYVYQYRVDGDLIAGSTQSRCDFLLENEDTKQAYFIELKGSNLGHAVEQIENTIKLFSTKVKGYSIFPRIVCHSNTHNVRDSSVLKFRKQYPNCIIRDIFIEEDI